MADGSDEPVDGEIVAEPDLLFNRTLRVKFVLLVAIVTVTAGITAALRRETKLRDMPAGRRVLLGVLGALALLLLVAIAAADRLIADAG